MAANERREALMMGGKELWQQALEELVAEVAARTEASTGKALSEQELIFAETALLAYNLAFPIINLKMVEIQGRVVS